MLDGRITVHDQEGFVRLAADGRHVADGTGVLCGDLISGHEIRLRDLDTGAILARVTEPTKALTPWAWSPSSDELLYQERDWSAAGGCGQEVRWSVLSAVGTSPVTDLRGLLTRWYGDRLVELICEDRRPGPDAALLDRWAEERQSCYSAGPPAGELRLGGKKVDVVEEVFVVGFRGF